VGENDDGRPFVFAGLQAVRVLQSFLGKGHLRVNFAGTGNEFVREDSSSLTNRLSWGLSVDQEFGSVVGGYLRLGWQTDKTSVLFKALYSGGMEIKGAAWGRDQDRCGVGLA